MKASELKKDTKTTVTLNSVAKEDLENLKNKDGDPMSVQQLFDLALDDILGEYEVSKKKIEFKK